ncbi:MAG: hypothetical protein GY820_08490 [Gammaproteobacteria bacterium]|nr:hypothetical protein [Gammaproteobacteria bacterium]
MKQNKQNTRKHIVATGNGKLPTYYEQISDVPAMNGSCRCLVLLPPACLPKPCSLDVLHLSMPRKQVAQNRRLHVNSTKVPMSRREPVTRN